ncbi:Uncharacterised protein [Helicobacter mustelae]|nr:Uncharacterised protein [Helicobacter mustelae]
MLLFVSPFAVALRLSLEFALSVMVLLDPVAGVACPPFVVTLLVTKPLIVAVPLSVMLFFALFPWVMTLLMLPALSVMVLLAPS